jgi:hypothetical protein
MAISLLLLAVLEQHGCSEDERHVYANDTECTGEDRVEEGVGEAHEGGHAADVCGCCDGGGTHAVRDEEGRCAVVVAAAVELYLVRIHSILPFSGHNN